MSAMSSGMLPGAARQGARRCLPRRRSSSASPRRQARRSGRTSARGRASPAPLRERLAPRPVCPAPRAPTLSSTARRQARAPGRVRRISRGVEPRGRVVIPAGPERDVSPDARRVKPKVGRVHERLGLGEGLLDAFVRHVAARRGERRQQVRELIEPQRAAGGDRVAQEAPAQRVGLLVSRARSRGSPAPSRARPVRRPRTREVNGFVESIRGLPREQLDLAQLDDSTELRLCAPRGKRLGAWRSHVALAASLSPRKSCARPSRSSADELQSWSEAVSAETARAMPSARRRVAADERGSSRGDPHRGCQRPGERSRRRGSRSATSGRPSSTAHAAIRPAPRSRDRTVLRVVAVSTSSASRQRPCVASERAERVRCSLHAPLATVRGDVASRAACSAPSNASDATWASAAAVSASAASSFAPTARRWPARRSRRTASTVPPPDGRSRAAAARRCSVSTTWGTVASSTASRMIAWRKAIDPAARLEQPARERRRRARR